MDDISLKPDPNLKGSYHRRIEDIDRALNGLGIPTGKSGADFLGYFFACEKLALGVIGIADRTPASTAYHRHAKINLTVLQKAAAQLALPISPDDLASMFADYAEQHRSPIGFSARVLRNNLVHDLGPTNAHNLVSRADLLVPTMRGFLSCSAATLAYLAATYRP